ncbi:MAG: DUF5723 family protein [Bacteroidota bacterium]
MLKTYSAFIFCLLLSFGLQAQQELGLHLMRDIGQSIKTNPALLPSSRLVIQLPSIYANYSHTAGTIDDLVLIDGDRNVLNVDRLISLADEENDLFVNYELETIGASFRWRNWGINVNHAIKSNTFLRYPKTLPQLFWQGNADFIGQTVEFGPEQYSFAYNEFGLGLAYEHKQWTIGGRVKFLTGIGDISTPRTQATLFTSDDVYQLQLETDYEINTSSFDATFLLDSISGLGVQYGWDDILSFQDIFTQNAGLAFDLGIRYRPNEKWELAASVIDIGQIDWTENIRNSISQGRFEYDGLDLGSILTVEDLSFDDAVDTLESIFQFEERNEPGYSTQLSTKIYLSAMYQWNENWRFAGMYYQERFQEQTKRAFALSAERNFLKMLRIGAVYAMRNERFDNIGLNVAAQLGPLRLFAMTDNVLAIVRPYDSENVNGRVGLSLSLL